MITVGYSSREHKPEFIEYLKKSSFLEVQSKFPDLIFAGNS